MDRHPCVEALKKGCLNLNLPTSTAKELVRFLLVKRFQEDEKLYDLSPSSKLDKLWHYMLLNTEVRDAVEQLVGRVSHTQDTERQPEALKMDRRCVAPTPWRISLAEPDISESITKSCYLCMEDLVV
jgi:hypothetical protein